MWYIGWYVGVFVVCNRWYDVWYVSVYGLLVFRLCLSVTCVAIHYGIILFM